MIIASSLCFFFLPVFSVMICVSMQVTWSFNLILNRLLMFGDKILMTLSLFSPVTNLRRGLGACLRAMSLEACHRIKRKQTMLLRSKLWYASFRVFPFHAFHLFLLLVN